MAGAAAAVGLVGCVAAVTVGFAAAGSAAVFGQRLTGIADAAALAAADAASGAVDGIPCEVAGSIAAAGGAELAECVVDGLIATVTVSSTFAHLPAAASARAGPPP